ncbi:MAG: ATP-binding protein [Desulfarculaceae bacterium]
MLFHQRLVTVPFTGEHLVERNQELADLLELSNLLSTRQTLDEVLVAGLDRLMEDMKVDCGRAYVLDDDAAALRLHASRGIDPRGLEAMDLGVGFSGKAAETRCLIAQRVEDLDDKKRAARLTACGMQSVMALPLIARNRVLGVINLGAQRVLELSMGVIDMLTVATNLVAVAAQNTQVAHELTEKALALQNQKETIEFFAYTASHDLKSPALAVHGLSRMLLQKYGHSLDEKGVELCRQIESASGHIEELVSEINAYIQAKEAPLNLEQVSMTEVLEVVRTDFAGEIEQRGLAWRLPERLPQVTGDRLALIRILQNLVDNALKYGGRNLTAIEVGYYNDNGEHVFWVSDDGIGLSPEQSGKVFNLFTRADTSKKAAGTGLGLAIVKATAKRHGGRAWVKSRPGKGSTFYFSIAKQPKPVSGKAKTEQGGPGT